MLENRADDIKQVTLYDADAVQGVQWTEERVIEGTPKLYNVVHHLAGCSDELYVEYEKLLKPRLRRLAGGVQETVTELRVASVHVYRAVKDRVDGWGATNGSNVDEEQMENVIQQAYFAVQIMPKPDAVLLGDAEADRPWEKPAASSEIPIRLRCLFSGEQVILSHYFKQETAAQRQFYEALTTRKKFEAGARMSKADILLPSNAKPLGRLYDALQERAEGYAGRIPLWHKVAALTGWMERNSDGTDTEGNA